MSSPPPSILSATGHLALDTPSVSGNIALLFMNSSRLVLLPLLSAALLAALPARAEVRLPSIISDNMVLMQEVPVNVWGWAEPQEEVTVKLGDKSVTGTTDFDGRWRVKLA